MKFTRKDADNLAEVMIKNPNNEFRLMSDGVLYKEDRASLQQGRDLFVGIKKLGRLPSWINPEDDVRVMWNAVLATFIEDERYEKLKYKTHLSGYLYNVVNQGIKILNGRVVKSSGYEVIDNVLRSTKHWEYRSREPIKIVKDVNNSSRIIVLSEDTNYINIALPKKVEKDAILRLLDRVWGIAKDDSRVKIIGNKKERIDYIEENYYLYEEEYRRHVELFNRLRQLWNWKLREDGIYKGTLDDGVLKELSNLTREFNEQASKDRPLGKLKDLENILRKERVRIEEMDEDVISLSVYL